MLANRLPLLWAFAGGCVASGAALGFFREEATVVPAEVAPFRSSEPHADSADPNEVDPTPTVADARRSLEKDAADDDMEPKTDPGSSVAEVLSRLEAAYRQGLTPVAARDEPAALNETAATSDVTSRTTPEPADTTAASVDVAAMHPPESPPKPSAPPAAAAEPTPERVLSAPVAPAPVVIARNDAPPRGISVGDVHVGDVHQNTQVGAVHQGDVYAVQQQLMVLQYLQLVAQSPHVRLAAPAHDPRRPATRRPHAFSLPLTNPDNPWGFDFPPTVLVK